MQIVCSKADLLEKIIINNFSPDAVTLALDPRFLLVPAWFEVVVLLLVTTKFVATGFRLACR